ncbi:ubiquitin carboxyl-terminal hydrolase L3 [Kwoniella heveanensis BCC8398]|uniref:Ubiquitin carboxyl-terminal hydrolase n=1 Tax=Kwoniella heveanensis BCC8398 TaxID=1296120 RepID=A0A1B9H0S4_9TREE|nr:ubiquitin carboxyl-terminal hydrolase L3 [Kwoniella heveanensis BCC8398]
MPSKWVPLEASPDVFNDWSKPLGLPDSLTFQDLFSLDPDFLTFIPKPHKAVLLLFPSEGKLGEAREMEDKEYNGLTGSEGKGWKGDGVWYIKQTIPNACGSIGLLHALLNLPEQSPDALAPDSHLAKFKAESLSKTPIERAKLLDEADFFTAAHTAAAQTGQSAIPEDLDVTTHFITFVEGVNENGEKRTVELDGNRSGPFDQGPSVNFLEDVAKVVQEKYFDRADGDVNFNMIVLAGHPED